MIMKSLFALILLLLLVQPASAQLMPEDIRIIREEVTKIVKAENDALEKRLREYVDLKFEVLDTKFTTKFEELDTKFTTKFEKLDTKFTTKFDGLSRLQTIVVILITGLIALIVVAIGIPQIILARKQRGQETLEAEIKTLREKVELLEQTRLIGPN